MYDIERREVIMNSLKTGYRVRVRDMIEVLDVSESTVRRDFEELVRSGKAVYVYGGIQIKKEKEDFHIPGSIDQEYAGISDRLCRGCAELVQNGMKIFVDGGTTYRTMMRYLKDKTVTVVTNNLLLAMYYQSEAGSKAELIQLGGTYDPKYYLTTGPMALDKIQPFQFDYAFIAAESVDIKEQAAYVADLYLASVKQVAMSRSTKVCLAVQKKKLQTRGLYRFADLEQFHVMYIEQGEQLPPLPLQVVEIK